MSILCSMVGASFTVAAVAQVLRARRDFYRSGNTVISTAQSKFGGSSIYFDGTDDWLETTYGIELTGDFTLEAWVYLPNVSGTKSLMTIGTENTGRVDFMVLNAAPRFDIYAATSATSSGAISTNTWTHIAYVRSGSTLTFYVGGTAAGTGTASGTIGRTDQIRIGTNTNSSEDWNGYIDELRLSSTARYTANFTPSTTPFTNDANTLLLMHGNGTNNSTFFDDDNGVRSQCAISSVNGANISSSQSYFGATSASFASASSQYALLAKNTDLTDLTVEFWYRATTLPGSGLVPLISFNNTLMYIGYSGGTCYDFYNGGSRISLNPVTINTGTWYNVAFVRSGGNITVYHNGTSVATGSSWSTAINWGSYDVEIGKYSSYYLNGFIDELRISNTARYTANFTAPTEPFVNDENTLLLMHANGTSGSTVFRDDNGAVGYTPKTLTAAGNAQTSTAQTKFGVTSGLFDGTGDYVNVGQPEYLNFGTGNWTIEGWYRASSTSGDHYMINFKAPTSGISGLYDISGGFGHWGINIYQGNWRAGAFNNKLVGGVASGVNAGIDTTTWHHFALVRDSATTLKYYIDGTQAGSTVTLSSGDNFNSTTCYIGNYVYQSGGATGWNGYIDDLRISNTARYTGNFTAPTAAFTPDANTMLLCDFNGANAGTTFTDKCGRVQKGITAVGNAQISTAQSKFGGASALFDGTTDYLLVGLDTSMALGSGNWTIEMWVRLNTTGLGLIYDSRPYSSNGLYPTIYTDGGRLKFYTNLADRIQSNVLSTATWYHLAVVKNSGSTIMYIDGTQQGSTYTDSNTYVNSGAGENRPMIGAAGDNAGGAGFNGYLDEVRVSNNARYTTTFTPSTTPFVNDANTLLLIHADGTNASTVFIDDNGIAPYTP